MLPKAFSVVLNLLESSGKQKKDPHFLWLVRLRERWLQYWKKDSYPSAEDPDRQEKLAEREDFEEIGKSAIRQQSFIAKVQAWAKKRWPHHPRVSDWMLLSLSDREPFDDWGELSRYSSNALKAAPSVHGVVVPRDRPIDKDDIIRWIVWLLPILESESVEPKAYQLKFTLADADTDANAAPPQVVKGLRRTLNHLSKRTFWWWLLRGGLMETRSERTWLVSIIAVGLALLGLFHFIPRTYLGNDLLVLSWAGVFIGAVVFLLVYLWLTIKRKYDGVAADANAWRALLERSRLGMILDNDNGLEVEGGSFGVTLALSTLLALAESMPPQSGFWRGVIGALKENSTSWLFTGRLLGSGEIEDVEDLDKKLIAALRHDEIRVFVIPKQVHNLGQPGVRNFADRIVRDVGPRVSPASAVVSASTKKDLVIKSFGTLSQLLFHVGGFRNYFAVMLLAASLCLAGVALWAGYGVWRLLDRPYLPEVLPVQLQVNEEATEIYLVLKIRSSFPEQYCAEISSHYWMSRTQQRFRTDGTNDFKLQRILSHGLDYRDGLIAISYYRNMLWRNLPPEQLQSIFLWERTVPLVRGQAVPGK